MSHDHHDDRADQMSDSGQGGDPPDAAKAVVGRRLSETVDAGWLRPRTRPSGRPRVSTVVLLLVWIGVLILYLEIRPGG